VNNSYRVVLKKSFWMPPLIKNREHRNLHFHNHKQWILPWQVRDVKRQIYILAGIENKWKIYFFLNSRSFRSKTLFNYYIISAIFVLFVSFFPITGNKIKFKKKRDLWSIVDFDKKTFFPCYIYCIYRTKIFLQYKTKQLFCCNTDYSWHLWCFG
jgi:hypothetical protein